MRALARACCVCIPAAAWAASRFSNACWWLRSRRSCSKASVVCCQAVVALMIWSSMSQRSWAYWSWRCCILSCCSNPASRYLRSAMIWSFWIFQSGGTSSPTPGPPGTSPPICSITPGIRLAWVVPMDMPVPSSVSANSPAPFSRMVHDHPCMVPPNMRLMSR